MASGDLFFGLTAGVRFNRDKQKAAMRHFDRHARLKEETEDDKDTLETVSVFDAIDPTHKKNRKSKTSNPEHTEGHESEEVDGSTSESDSGEEGENGEGNPTAKLKVRVLGTDVPKPIDVFDDLHKLGVREFLTTNVLKAGYEKPTAIQRQCLPILHKGRELMAVAPTGSGKTAAFAIPILSWLQEPKKGGVRAVVISPTRELATQTYREFKKLSEGKKFRIMVLTKAAAAGSNLGHSQAQNYDIIISTPMRLVSIIQQGMLKLSNVQRLVLDEADKLFELGFLEQIDEIILACTHKDVQRALFSATIMPPVEEMARSFLRDPIRVVVGLRNAAAETIDQKLVYVGREEGKMVAMRQLIQKGIKPPMLVFVQSKDRAKELFSELVYDGLNVDVIHADRTQAQRDNIVKNFRLGRIWILIATDLMARGVDFKGVNMVVNYDFPQSTVSYIHRIGRTGRAGRKGSAITFFTDDDVEVLRTIANVMKTSGCEVPDWMLTLKKPGRKRWKESYAPPRAHIATVSKYDINKAIKKRDYVRNTKRKKEMGSNANGEDQENGEAPTVKKAKKGGQEKAEHGEKKSVASGKKKTKKTKKKGIE